MAARGTDRMTQPKLTIAIPTYNRAKQLDRQLNWAVNAIAGRWDEIELLVSDNASPDETPQICQKWQAQTDWHMRIFRQTENIGLIKNCLFCIQEARGDFVWTVSDDDVVLEGTLGWVLSKISGDADSQLAFIHLNGSMSSPKGIIFRQSVYPFQSDQTSAPGCKLLEICIDLDEDWLLLITASIYKTTIAQQAIKAWPDIKNNLAFPLFLAGYAAAHGAMTLRSEPSLLDMVYYARPNWLVIIHREIPEVYRKLAEFGYTTSLIRRQILKRLSFLSFILKFPTDFLSALPTYWFALRLSKH
jgi:glycosyltransferase involved in cell wall biosynthesis